VNLPQGRGLGILHVPPTAADVFWISIPLPSGSEKPKVGATTAIVVNSNVSFRRRLILGPIGCVPVPESWKRCNSQPGFSANQAAGTFHDGKAAFHLMGSWDLREGELDG
jgi:hypothetical protein